MKTIRTTDVDEAKAIHLYHVEQWTLRRVAAHLGTNHHRICRILKRKGIEVATKGKKRPAFTQEHRAAIGRASKGRISVRRGTKTPDDSKRKMVASKLGTTRDLSVYANWEKFLLLTRLTSKHRLTIGSCDDDRFAFIDKFYFDESFSALYDAWVANRKCRWWMPSLDHDIPISKGGSFDLSNLRFVTWFENRAKADMTLQEWSKFKRDTGTTSDLFIENIVANWRKG